MAKDTYETHDEMEAPKEGLGNGLVYVTTLLLLVAVFVMQRAMADKFDRGMFGKGGSPTAPAPIEPGPAMQ